MCKAWMTRTATLAATLFTVSCAAAPAAPTPTDAKQPPAGTATTAKPTDTKTPVAPLDIKKPISTEMPPAKPETVKGTGTYDRVALIWGFERCPRRPWIVTVVDLGTRSVMTRTMANTAELPPYLPVPPGEACVKGPCPTVGVVVPTPMSLTGGTGIMTPGTGKGLMYVRNSGTTECPEPPVLDDIALLDMAVRFSGAR